MIFYHLLWPMSEGWCSQAVRLCTSHTEFYFLTAHRCGWAILAQYCLLAGISTSDYPINAKFCSIKQNHVLTQVTWPKYQISKIQHGGRPAAILKIVLSQYLSRKSSDFNEIWYADADFASKVGYLTKYQNFCKFKMADGRHIENCLLAISQRKIIRLTRHFAG